MALLDRQRWQRASAHLDSVLDLTAGDREACLAALRAEDPAAAADLEALLAEHRALSARAFLEGSVEVRPTRPPLAGLAVGAYTLTEPIGHGGMGSVWLAARSDGRFEGTAAVKLLNAERVGRNGRERFRREGTILARLTHPNIARLIDAGVSTTGQPYLVLEHVGGRHIDEYCDGHALGVEARIRLFLDVLSAVAHAHANLIVHRDLKPSNVLVAEDGQVKLLDFGIAKLLEDDRRQTEPTLTREAGAVLTPRYAAPEQVTGGSITTATDVYALGVLLYELLSGRHPIGSSAGSPAEMMKAIVDVEPLRVSAVVADAAAGPEAIAQIAARRATTIDRLRRRLQGDLDTIVAKALKKNPDERYASVGEFADDLRRFSENQPIGARPDTFRYRAGKFARRHRRGLAAAAAAVAVVGSVIVFYTAQLARERDRAALEAAKASKMSELLAGLLTASDPYRTPDAKELTVRGLLDASADRIERDLAGQPELLAEMFTVIGRTYERMGLLAKAQPLEEKALALGRRAFGPEHVRVAQSLNDLGVLHRGLGNLQQSQALLEESLAMRRRLLGPYDKDVAVTAVELSRVLKDRGLGAQAEPLIREGLAIRKKIFGDEHRETATSKNDLGLLLWERGDLDGAEAQFRDNLETTTRVLGPDHSNTAAAKGNLALVLRDKGDYATAEKLLRESLAIDGKTRGRSHPGYANTLANLGVVFHEQGRLAEAQSLLEEALGIVRPKLGGDHVKVLVYTMNLARTQIARGQPAAAEPALRHVLEVRRRVYPAGDWRIGQAQSLLGGSLLAQGRYGEAEPLLLDAAAILKPVSGRQAKDLVANRAWLDALYAKWGQPPRAAMLRAQAGQR